MQSGGQNKRRFPCRTNARRVRVSAAPITIGKKDTNGQSNLIGPVFHSNTRPVFVTDQRDGNRSLTWQQQTGSTGQDLLFFFSFFFLKHTLKETKELSEKLSARQTSPTLSNSIASRLAVVVDTFRPLRRAQRVVEYMEFFWSSTPLGSWEMVARG